MRIARTAALLLLALALIAGLLQAKAAEEPLPEGAPVASLDLMTAEGLAAVNGEWRSAPAIVVPTTFFAPGADGQPSTTPVATFDIEPKAGAKNFDDSGWAVIAPERLTERRTNGRVAFEWYRLSFTIPERIGDIDPAGTTLVFETSVDDYAEIWVDGELARAAGQSGGSVIKGWNADNRLVVARNVTPGQAIDLAIFGINGPLSNPPTNYVYVRKATLEFHAGATGPMALEPAEVNVEVVRNDPAIDAIVPRNPKVFKLAEGFVFTEGPLWVPSGDGNGRLLFSDPNSNTIYSYDGALAVFRTPSGYAGADIAEYGQPGSNGLTLDPEGRLTIAEHGNHRISRLEADGSLAVLADAFEGKRLNSPNDLVYKSDGSLYFTDPPFGLPKFYDDPRKELPYSGVYRWDGDALELMTTDLKGPNGIAFSPDEKFLYVGDWDEEHKVVMRYPVKADGSLGEGEVFVDMTNAPGEDAIDGVKVDETGNVYVSGPGGLWILSPEGRHLGTIIPPKHPHNMAWGDADGKTLYLTAQSAIYKIRLNIPGIRP